MKRRVVFVFLTLLMLAFVALFARLAAWQYQRAQERFALLADYAAARQGPVRPLPETGVEALPRYARVSVSGRYVANRQIILIERPRPHGQAIGAEVLTPLLMSGDRFLLVNRGWIRADAEGRTTVNLAPPAGTVQLSGHLADLSRAGVQLGGEQDGPGHWPRRLLYPDWADLDALYGPGLLHRVLWLSPEVSGGYARNWEYRPARGPQENYSYMAQWAGLAATVFIVWLVLALRAWRRARKERQG